VIGAGKRGELETDWSEVDEETKKLIPQTG